MRHKFIAFNILFFSFFFAYYPVIYDLRDSVISNDLAHHAPLVVVLSGFLIFQKREVLIAALDNSEAQGTLYFFLAGLFLNLLGQAAGVYYLSQLSIPLTLYGMIRYTTGAAFSRQLAFPLLLLLTAFPIPGKIYMELVFPLKLLVTKASGICLALMGYPVVVYGNIIEISNIVLGVVDACSGLNSLMAILTLSIFYTHLIIHRWTYSLVVILAMLPVIMIANIIRVTASAMMAVRWGPGLIEGELHWIWGAGVFMIAVLGLLGISKLMLRVKERSTLYA